MTETGSYPSVSVPSMHPAQANAGATGESLDLGWSDPPGMVGLSFKNFFLKILTIGIYGFWGKTEVRRRIWSAARLNGEPLQYTGTGKELFLGFLIVFGVFLLPVLLLSAVLGVALGPDSTALTVFQAALYAVFFFLAGVATYRAQRYRLSRTRWRGIRGGMEGSTLGFAWTYFWTGLLIPLTLGWISPWRSTMLQSLLTSDMRFGDRPFRFTASSGPLYGRFALLWLGAVAIITCVAVSWGVLITVIGYDLQTMQRRASTGGAAFLATILLIIYGSFFVGVLLYMLLSGWYRALMMNHFAAHTHFEDATFKGRATAWSLIWLNISNFLLVLFTFGLLAPIAQARSARYFVDRLAIDGSAQLGDIAQRAADQLKRGEGLAEAFDIDAF